MDKEAKISRHVVEMCVQGCSLQHYLHSKILQIARGSVTRDYLHKLRHIHTAKRYEAVKNSEEALYVPIWKERPFKKQGTEQSI